MIFATAPKWGGCFFVVFFNPQLKNIVYEVIVIDRSQCYTLIELKNKRALSEKEAYYEHQQQDSRIQQTFGRTKSKYQGFQRILDNETPL